MRRVAKRYIAESLVHPIMMSPEMSALRMFLVGARYGECMERMCTQCHAVVGGGVEGDWCPACGGAMMERPALVETQAQGRSAIEVDHRGIVLPRRHALGGIITPQ
jgi:hypothetical protein